MNCEVACKAEPLVIFSFRQNDFQHAATEFHFLIQFLQRKAKKEEYASPKEEKKKKKKKRKKVLRKKERETPTMQNAQGQKIRNLTTK